MIIPTWKNPFGLHGFHKEFSVEKVNLGVERVKLCFERVKLCAAEVFVSIFH